MNTKFYLPILLSSRDDEYLTWIVLDAEYVRQLFQRFINLQVSRLAWVEDQQRAKQQHLKVMERRYVADLLRQLV